MHFLRDNTNINICIQLKPKIILSHKQYSNPRKS